ncbi:MAG: hypothetical protein JSR39_08695 [Verrucomicrobia bacterium]|nr:hypothetical protein [Verrucomicrobiota bacterium]
MRNKLLALLLIISVEFGQAYAESNRISINSGNVEGQSGHINHDVFSIAEEDRAVLEAFFRDLLFSEGFAFTLFGDKPISVNEYDTDNSELFSKSSAGYRTWSKYAPVLPESNYLFLFYENQMKGFFEITLINKRAVRKVFALNKDKFFNVFGSKISSDELISLIVEKGSLWNTAVKEREDIIGILLGYGRINAELFQKRSELGLRKGGIKKSRTKPSPGYRSTAEELKAISRMLRPFDPGKRNSLSFMSLPGFVADLSSNETILLKQKYTDQRKQITQKFAKGDILETVLEQLSSAEQ